MTKDQKRIIKCAYLDLIGSKNAALDSNIEDHDWRAHELTIDEILKAFPFVKEDDK